MEIFWGRALSLLDLDSLCWDVEGLGALNCLNRFFRLDLTLLADH